MDQDAKKKGRPGIVYGLYVLGARRDEAHAMTVNRVTQISFEPPMIALATENEAHTLPMVRETGAFTISILPTGSRQLAGKLGRSSANTPDKLAGIAHHLGPTTGATILDDATGWLQWRLLAEQKSGDHTLVGGSNRGRRPGRREDADAEETGFRYAG